MQTAFCPWYSLADVAEHAPSRPGVFQVRVRRGLLTYPRGKSAMVHYGYGDDVAQAASAWAQRYSGADWLCRHMDDDDPNAMKAVFERVFAMFVHRFGAPPTPPAE